MANTGKPLADWDLVKLRQQNDKFYEDITKYKVPNPYGYQYPARGYPLCILPYTQWLFFLQKFIVKHGFDVRRAHRLSDFAQGLLDSNASQINNKEYRKLYHRIYSRSQFKRFIHEQMQDHCQDTLSFQQQVYMYEAALRLQRQRLRIRPEVLAYRFIWHHHAMYKQHLKLRACWIPIYDPHFLLPPRIESRRKDHDKPTKRAPTQAMNDKK